MGSAFAFRARRRRLRNVPKYVWRVRYSRGDGVHLTRALPTRGQAEVAAGLIRRLPGVSNVTIVATT